jgi:hypothetical protein
MKQTKATTVTTTSAIKGSAPAAQSKAFNAANYVKPGVT